MAQYKALAACQQDCPLSWLNIKHLQPASQDCPLSWLNIKHLQPASQNCPLSWFHLKEQHNFKMSSPKSMSLRTIYLLLPSAWLQFFWLTKIKQIYLLWIPDFWPKKCTSIWLQILTRYPHCNAYCVLDINMLVFYVNRCGCISSVTQHLYYFFSLVDLERVGAEMRQLLQFIHYVQFLCIHSTNVTFQRSLCNLMEVTSFLYILVIQYTLHLLCQKTKKRQNLLRSKCLETWLVLLSPRMGCSNNMV
jgi:hypothetical protein